MNVFTPRHRQLEAIKSNSLNSFVYNVVVLGGKRVGKTALLKQYVFEQFHSEYKPTVHDLYERTIRRGNDKAVYVLRLVDTIGSMQYEFPAMYRKTISDGDAFLLVYSVADEKSFQELNDYIKDINRLKNGKAPILIVGSKCDYKVNERMVTTSEGRDLADDSMCGFIETSARYDVNVNEVFQNILSQIDVVQNHPQKVKQEISDRIQQKKQAKCVIM